MQVNRKRLFFGFEIRSPWPEKLPYGRIIEENQRHLTLAFLGGEDFLSVKHSLSSFPMPSFKVSLAGKFNKCLFLPNKKPNVVAWQVEWLQKADILQSYQKTLIAWLQSQGFKPDDRRDFLPHVSLCRTPFTPSEWENEFIPLPVTLNYIHLYESVGNLIYKPLWTFPLRTPFDEIEHTADLAFEIHGENLEQLQTHAFVALAFKFPLMLNFFEFLKIPLTLDELIFNLNYTVSLADENFGCPFKAVSYHGELITTENGTLIWEMIVDV